MRSESRSARSASRIFILISSTTAELFCGASMGEAAAPSGAATTLTARSDALPTLSDARRVVLAVEVRPCLALVAVRVSDAWPSIVAVRVRRRWTGEDASGLLLSLPSLLPSRLRLGWSAMVTLMAEGRADDFSAATTSTQVGVGLGGSAMETLMAGGRADDFSAGTTSIEEGVGDDGGDGSGDSPLRLA